MVDELAKVKVALLVVLMDNSEVAETVVVMAEM